MIPVSDPVVQAVLERVYHSGFISLVMSRGYGEPEAEGMWQDFIRALPEQSDAWGTILPAIMNPLIDGLVWQGPMNPYGEPTWAHECPVHPSGVS